MNLVIDIGNTAAKLAVFQEDELVGKIVVPANDLEKKIEEIKIIYPKLDNCILSAVINVSQKLIAKLEKDFSFLQLTPETRQPFKNLYTTPKTLGRDRIALAAAASQKFVGKNVLIIDAGTCVTYDFLNENNQYLGGGISPGLQMRFAALHKFTAKLPLLQPQENVELIGNTTNKSIQTGVINGLACEIDGIINFYHTEYKYLTVILTGGDMLFLSKRVKNSIFANSNFLLEGLNYILEFNKTQ